MNMSFAKFSQAALSFNAEVLQHGVLCLRQHMARRRIVTARRKLLASLSNEQRKELGLPETESGWLELLRNHPNIVALQYVSHQFVPAQKQMEYEDVRNNAASKNSVYPC